MLRFKLGPIPVEAHLSHFLIAGVLAFTFVQGSPGSTTWPGSVLAHPGTEGYSQAYLTVLISWLLIISLSTLGHELGHALAARFFGYSPSIRLVGLGGLTTPNVTRMPWHQDVLFTLAGPGAGLLLAVLSGGLLLLLRSQHLLSEPSAYLLEAAASANVWWAVVNLVPVLPLDGGRLSALVMVKLFGRKGFAVSQVVALLFSASMVFLGAILHAPILAFMFALWGFRSLAVLLETMRGANPMQGTEHPMLEVARQAEVALEGNQLAEARRLAQSLVDGEFPPFIRSKGHHLLGLVALKEGEGRRALDHFAQVQAEPVAAAHLAAAFSLIGDDTRALPLWHAAAKQPDGAAARVEFAGALVRAGHEAQARQVPGVRPAQAFFAAERVYYVRGEYPKAAEAAEAAFREEPSAQSAYLAACAWARAKDPGNALRTLALAAQNGYRDAAAARVDPDLAPLRGDPTFESWLGSLG